MSVSRPLGRRTAGVRAGHVRPLCRVLAQRHSAKINDVECSFFADGRHSAKVGHAECRVFCRVRCLGHSAKPEALGNYEFSGSAYYIFFSLINGVIMVCWYEVGERD